MDFKDWFCLKNRESFTIDPQVNPDDARFYFGRDEIKKKITQQLRRAFVDPKVPKMLIYGNYGSGKTQTLYHFEHYLTNVNPDICSPLKPKTFHLVLEMTSKSDHKDWHLFLMEALGKTTVTGWVANLLDSTKDLDEELEVIFRNVNMISAAKNLRAGGDLGLLAWRWFCGRELKPNELEQLKVTRSLGDLGAGDLVSALVGIGRLAERSNYKLIFFMDEAESFQNVKTGDATESLHNYLRKLSDNANSTIGFIISFLVVTVDQMPELVYRGDIRSRIGEHCIIELGPLPSIEYVQKFLKELLTELIDQKKAEKKIQKNSLSVSLETYPFTADAFGVFCDYAYGNPALSLPRYIIKALNECCISVWDIQKQIVDVDIVNDIAPHIFAE